MQVGQVLAIKLTAGLVREPAAGSTESEGSQREAVKAPASVKAEAVVADGTGRDKGESSEKFEDRDGLLGEGMPGGRSAKYLRRGRTRGGPEGSSSPVGQPLVTEGSASLMVQPPVSRLRTPFRAVWLI